MKSLVVKSLMRVFVFLFVLALTVSGVWAATANTFVLSDEGTGLITMLSNAGYGSDNLYDALLAIQATTDPSISTILTDTFLATLASCPANSDIFTIPLNTIIAGSSVAISDDCTVQSVNIHGATYFNQPGTSTLQSNISGVGTGLFTHTTNPSNFLTSFQANTNTYNVLAIGWASNGSASVPTLTEWGMILFMVLAGLGAAYYLRRQKRATS
jgi:hypothetical protein